MKEFLRKIYLVDYLTVKLNLTKNEFVNKLNSITDPGSTGIFNEPFEAFSTSKNEFKGKVNSDGFKLKRKKKFFDTNPNIAVATGKIKEENGELIIETEINGFNNIMIFFFGFILLVYIGIITSAVFSDENSDFPIFPFFLLHGTFMTLIPYFIMRRSVKKMKYELEREFFYLTKK